METVSKQQSERFIQVMREEKRRVLIATSKKTEQYHVARLKALIDGADALGLDRTEFNFVFLK